MSYNLYDFGTDFIKMFKMENQEPYSLLCFCYCDRGKAEYLSEKENYKPN